MKTKKEPVLTNTKAVTWLLGDDVRPDDVLQWIHKRDLPARKVGRKYRYDVNAEMRWARKTRPIMARERDERILRYGRERIHTGFAEIREERQRKILAQHRDLARRG